MKIFFDLLPVIVFFLVYKLTNIYTATLAAIIVAVLALLIVWIKKRRIDYMILVSSSIVVILGIITLILHDDIFIKWKPTVICWAFGLIFLGSQFIGKKPLIQITLEAVVERTNEDKIVLPGSIWSKLNMCWVIFYLFLGALNLYVVYHFSTNTWVNFKLFGMMGLMIIFVVGQSVYLAKHIANHPAEKSDES